MTKTIGRECRAERPWVRMAGILLAGGFVFGLAADAPGAPGSFLEQADSDVLRPFDAEPDGVPAALPPAPPLALSATGPTEIFAALDLLRPSAASPATLERPDMPEMNPHLAWAGTGGREGGNLRLASDASAGDGWLKCPNCNEVHPAGMFLRVTPAGAEIGVSRRFSTWSDLSAVFRPSRWANPLRVGGPLSWLNHRAWSAAPDRTAKILAGEVVVAGAAYLVYDLTRDRGGRDRDRDDEPPPSDAPRAPGTGPAPPSGDPAPQPPPPGNGDDDESPF